MSARLLDESAGGFAVSVDGPPDLSVGQMVQLRTDSGWFDACVANIREVAASGDEDAVDLEEPTPCYRVGLLRRGEQVLADEVPMSLFARSLRFRCSRGCPTGAMLLIFGILLTLMIVLASWGWRSLVWHTELSSPKSTAPAIDGKVNLPAPPSLNRVPARTPPSPLQVGGIDLQSKEIFSAGTSANPHAVGQSALGSFADKTHESERLGPVSDEELRRMVRRLAGATALTLSDVIERLQLSHQQQVEIGRIARATSEAMQRLSLEGAAKKMERGQFAQRCDELLSDSRRQALDLLTPKQRVQWDELLDEAHATSEKDRVGEDADRSAP